MGERFKDAKFLQRHISEARRIACRLASNRVDMETEHDVFSGQVALESPLEAAFWVWWKTLSRYAAVEEGVISKELRLVTQREVEVGDKSYRLDFVVEPTASWAAELAAANLTWKPLAVEVDGHTFHEKTREQVTYRNTRDRLLQQAGWTVWHISFDEMESVPGRAVYDVLKFAMDQYNALAAVIHRQQAS